MKALVIVLVLLLFAASGSATAQEMSVSGANTDEELEGLLSEEDLNTTVNEKKEIVKTPDQDLVIAQIDEEKGYKFGSYSIGEDKGRIAVSYYFNADLFNATGISDFEALYGKKWGRVWIEGFVSRATLQFKEVTDNNAAATGVALSDALRDSSEDLLRVGAGLMYRTALIQNLVPSNTIFETMAAYATYNSFSENQESKDFSGLGYKADLGIHKRASENFHFGMRLSYNLASVKREASGNETSASRTLVLRWMALGFDFNFYF